MISRALIAFLVCAAGMASLRAGARDELIFNINTALKTRDGAGFAHCFNFRGTDDATRQSFIKMISQILSWPSYYAFTSERTGEGNPRIEQDGKAFRLNGDWKYQVHIYPSKDSKGGFVFPAGSTAGGMDLILVAVPAVSEKASSGGKP
jgi:hypothetical protein